MPAVRGLAAVGAVAAVGTLLRRPPGEGAAGPWSPGPGGAERPWVGGAWWPADSARRCRSEGEGRSWAVAGCQPMPPEGAGPPATAADGAGSAVLLAWRFPARWAGPRRSAAGRQGVGPNRPPCGEWPIRAAGGSPPFAVASAGRSPGDANRGFEVRRSARRSTRMSRTCADGVPTGADTCE